jgi:undecaprenyl-diphosphatase
MTAQPRAHDRPAPRYAPCIALIGKPVLDVPLWRDSQQGGDVAASGQRMDPVVARTSATGWRAWLGYLATAGRLRLGGLGLALVVGFGAGVLALYAFASLAEDVASQETQQLDTAVLLWLRQFSSPTLDAVATGLSLLGSEVLVVLVVAALVALGYQRRWGAALALVLVVGGAELLNSVLKYFFHRTRPGSVDAIIAAQVFSFPSGHAMVAAAFYSFLAYLAWRVLPGWQRWICAGALLLLVLLIGWSRLYLGVHYFTDVVAGYLAGFLWTDAVIIGSHFLTVRRRATTAQPG